MSRDVEFRGDAEGSSRGRVRGCLQLISQISFAFFLLLALAQDVFARDRVVGTAYARDGDTIVVAGVPIRLNGVDAPELSNRYGRDAKLFMQRAIRGREITCELNGERTYDRWVGVCFVMVDTDAVDLGAALIANGYALDCARYSGGRYRSLEPAGARQRLRQARYC